MEVPPALPTAPKRPAGWWERNWKWAVTLGSLAIVCAIACFIGLIFFGVFRMIKSSEPYQKALALAVAEPAVQASLGTPIRPRFYVWGNLNFSGTTGNASLEFPITGPKGQAKVYVDATKQNGEWTYSKVLVRIGGTNTLHLKP